MGVYSWNNMGNNLKDCAVGDAADLIIHLGDHAYNEGESDEARADGYMQAWQPVLVQGLRHHFWTLSPVFLSVERRQMGHNREPWFVF